MHLVDDLAIPPLQDPVIVRFVKVADGSNLGAWKAGERVQGRDVVNGTKGTIEDRKPDEVQDSGRCREARSGRPGPGSLGVHPVKTIAQVS